MKICSLLSVLLLSVSTSYGQFSTKMHIVYSKNVKDSFETYISTPPTFDVNHIYNVVYYCDANLKSGILLRKLLSTGKYNATLSNVMFVGIGHLGNYHVLRRRDFILPTINGKDTIARDQYYG